jgi:O-antigen ligase
MLTSPATATSPAVIVRRHGRSDRSSAAAPRYWGGAARVAMVIVAVLGVRVHEAIPYVQYARPVVLAVCVGGFLLVTKSSRAALRDAVRDRTAMLALAYVLWMFVTVPFALWPGQAFGISQITLLSWTMIVAVLLCEPRPQLLRFTSTAFVASIGVLGALVLMQGGGGRLGTRGTMDPNDLAAVMAMGLPFALGMAVRDRGLRRLAALAAALIMAAVVVRTESRGGTIAFVLGAVIFSLGLPGRRKFVLLAAIVLAGIGAWSLATPDFRDRISSITSLDQDYNYTEYGGRKQIWARARGYIAEHPVTGLGAGNFGVAEGATAREHGQPAVWAATHNAYLQAFAELGVLGGVLFLSLVITSAYRGWKLWRGRVNETPTRRPEFFASVCAFATSAYFLSHAYFFTFFALCALTALADRARTANPDSAWGAPRRAGVHGGSWRGGMSRIAARRG